MLLAKSVIEYLKCIEDMPAAMMFRGQLDSSFSLIPSIARYAKSLSGYDSIRSVEEHLLLEFEKFVYPIQDLRNVSLIEKLIQAQHYGLPTRLLDWSTNPLKALYFSVENACFDSIDGEVVVFSPLGWFEGTKEVENIERITAFYPELLNERINAQDGCFTAFPLPSVGFNVLDLEEENYPGDIEFISFISIPKTSKIDIRRELNQLGINHRTIYPGIDGVAKWIKSNLAGHVI